MSVPDSQLEQPDCVCAAHPDECGCSMCHDHKEHDWREWTVFPLCKFCVAEMRADREQDNEKAA